METNPKRFNKDQKARPLSAVAIGTKLYYANIGHVKTMTKEKGLQTDILVGQAFPPSAQRTPV